MTFAAAGPATARFVDNPWDKQPKGEAYQAMLGADTVKALDAIGADYTKLVEAAFK